jgi:hypothetical protein
LSAAQAAPADRLQRRLVETVAAADEVWSYNERLLVRGAPRESPFQLRRARVDGAQRRFAVAAAKLEREAAAWADGCDTDTVGAQCKLAVARMQRWFLEHPVPERFPLHGGIEALDTTVDLLENALANLQRRSGASREESPFRRAPRQDVTRLDPPVSSRHGRVGL